MARYDLATVCLPRQMQLIEELTQAQALAGTLGFALLTPTCSLEAEQCDTNNYVV